MRVLVCGGRYFNDEHYVDDVLSELSPTLIITGAAPGADALAEWWAGLHGIPVMLFPAQWSYHGRSAGPIRNASMLKFGAPDLVVAFPGGRGTADMVCRAKDARVPVRWCQKNGHPKVPE